MGPCSLPPSLSYGRELNDLRNFCLRKSQVSIERILVCIAIENLDLAEHDIHCLPCFYTNDVTEYRNNYDVILMSN